MTKQEKFISTHKKSVIDTTLNTGLFPSVKMAQMIVESGWGETAPVKYANNYFGIKADRSWKGEKVELNTPKDAKKKNYFRKYASASDSLKDHSDFLIQNKRYENNGVFKAKTPEDQIDAISKAGYAESKNYANTLKSIIKSNNLKRLDEEAKLTSKKKVDFVAVALISAAIVTGYVLYTKFIKK
jgi:flagellum-specific peptidoglycan hydrolase FlgJ